MFRLPGRRGGFSAPKHPNFATFGCVLELRIQASIVFPDACWDANSAGDTERRFERPTVLSKFVNHRMLRFRDRGPSINASARTMREEGAQIGRASDLPFIFQFDIDLDGTAQSTSCRI